LIEHVRQQFDSLPGQMLQGKLITAADDFSYTDPVDEAVAENQGIRILFEDQSRLIFRLSGTGTQGATLRVYLEQYEPNADQHDEDTQAVLYDLARIADKIANIKELTGKESPDVVT